MAITALRILPPLAIGRLGSGETPLDNYTTELDPVNPLGYRTIKPEPTLIVNAQTGEISSAVTPDAIRFKDNGRMRPVAPFLEVFAVTGKNRMEPLTLDLLAENNLSARSISWQLNVANRKVYRRTADKHDIVAASTGWFSGHDPRPLKGHCKNFIKPEYFIDFGHVRYIRPNDEFPEIRLRFTPAQGLIYGPPESAAELADPSYYHIPPERAIYKKDGDWNGFQVTWDGGKGKFQSETLPPDLYAIRPPAPSWLWNNIAISRGYFDDACDGIAEVRLRLEDGSVLTAKARVTAGPPTVIPDSYFVRCLADDLDQIVFGPEVSAKETPDDIRARAEDIIRRAYETVHFMNLQVMNGNPFKGRNPLSLDSMPEEEAGDNERAIRPVMSPSSVDTLAVLGLHQQVFTALSAGAVPWFEHLLRRPDKVTDYTDFGRRKMPALMCGADNSYLALTWRQIDTIRRAAAERPFMPAIAAETSVESKPPRLTPRNLSAQIHYEAAGNPINSRPVSAISNCCPGLEMDFRAVWRRMFEGIVLREYDNLVIDIDPDVKDPHKRALKGHRLLRVDGVQVMAEMIGPATTDLDGNVLLTTNQNPYGLGPLEWSNSLAHVLHKYQGKKVRCDFSKEESLLEQQPFQEHPKNYVTFELSVRHFFDEGTAFISGILAEPGELTQGLCSPWQNDYRECSCYYWASARPDFINVQPDEKGLSAGDNWFQKKRTGDYVVDDYVDSRLVLYDDLFREWEKWLRIQIKGTDAPESGEVV
jgi:hypothetical protein